jgi:hypothetical protein
MQVVVGPTPDLDAVFEDLVEKTARGATRGSTYLGSGHGLEPDVAWLFRVAAALYRAAPWAVVGDAQVLRLDVPALEVEGVGPRPGVRD